MAGRKNINQNENYPPYFELQSTFDTFDSG